MKTVRWFTLFTLCTLLLAAPACKKKGSGDAKAKDDMAAKADDMGAKADDMGAKGVDRPAPRRAAGSLEDKLLGKWTIDFDKMKETDPDMKKLPADKVAELKKMMEKMVITVTKGNLEMKDPEGKVEKSTYTVKSQAGNKLVLDTKDVGKDKVETETFEFTDDDHIKVSKAGEKDVVYAKRVK